MKKNSIIKILVTILITTFFFGNAYSSSKDLLKLIGVLPVSLENLKETLYKEAIKFTKKFVLRATRCNT